MKQTIKLENEINELYTADRDCLLVMQKVDYQDCREDDVFLLSDSGSCVDEYYVLQRGQKIWAKVAPEKRMGTLEIEYEVQSVSEDELFSSVKELADLASRYPVLEKEKSEFVMACDLLEQRLMEEKERNKSVIQKIKNRLKK